jgi:cytochrome c
MPYPDSGRLSNDEVYAVTAYLLYANGIIEADAILNQVTLPQVNMPNREGFYWAEGR